jgi:hypothetical protein
MGSSWTSLFPEEWFFSLYATPEGCVRKKEESTLQKLVEWSTAKSTPVQIFLTDPGVFWPTWVNDRA